MENGAKVMRPVLTRQKYLELRQLAVHKNYVSRVRQGDADAKKRLLQFNYSCIPGEDKKLKGCTQMSSSVGMDVDHIAPEKMSEVAENILSKKDEIGLLMLERSVRGEGYHLVFKRDVTLSQEDNLKRVSDILGVEYDKGAKDITRVFFATTDSEEDLLYLDDELFRLTPCPSHKERGVETPTSQSILLPCPAETSEGKGLGKGAEGASPQSLKAFDLCCKQADLDPDTMDIWGEHNWHTNLMSVLSVGLPKLMSKNQLFAVVREKLPNYSQTKDCQTLIDYFYEKYTADKGFMSVALRNINAQAQKEGLNEETEDDKDLQELSQGWNPPEVPKKIPRIMDLLARNYDPRFRQMLLLSALPVLSAHASHFRATYLSGAIIGPQQFVAVIGGSGKGKGNATKLYNEMIEFTLKNHDDNEWEKVRVNTELRDQKANAKDRPPKYHPKIRLFETTSKSSILELQTNLGKNGMLLGQFSEVDGLSSATRSAFSDISVLLRKAWDMDWHRQFYMSDSTCNTYCQMSISLLMAGTVKAMLERMFSDSNCEGGLMQRCIPVLVPESKRTFRPPKINYLNEEEKKERDALILDLYQKDLSLGDSTFLLDTPMTNKAIGEWFDSLEMRYNDGELSEAEADLSHRCGEFILRAAIPLIALYGKETKEIVDFARWVGESAHYTMCHIFGHRVQKDINTSNELLSEHLDGRKTAEPLLDKLPDVFTVKEFKEQRVKAGQSSEVRMLLSRYCKNGKLERIGRGVYKKCIIVSVTNKGDCTSDG